MLLYQYPPAFAKAHELGALQIAALIPDLLPYGKTNMSLDEMVQLVQDILAFEKTELQVQKLSDAVVFNTVEEGTKAASYIELAKAINQAIYGADYPYTASEVVTNINEVINK